MVLHRQPGVDEVEDGFAQRVAAHQLGADQSQQQQRQQLSPASILGGQSKGDVVLMVQLVDFAVQPRITGGKQIKSLRDPHRAEMTAGSTDTTTVTFGQRGRTV